MLGTLFIISAPSGAGKTSLVKSLVNGDLGAKISVSHTTRKPRPGEVEGLNYHFISESQFEDMVQQHAFLEYANVFGNYYGTSKAWVEQTLATGIDVILEIDWQGALQIKTLMQRTVGIYVLPPSTEELRSRLNSRDQDDAAEIERRLASARTDISHYSQYDYLIINDEFDAALSDLRTIFKANKLTLNSQVITHQNLINNLLTC